MSDSPEQDKDALLQELVTALVEDVAHGYRITPQDAADLIMPMVAKDRALVEAMARKQDLRELRRMRVYKDMAKAAKKTVYAHLRRYKRDDDIISDLTLQLEALSPGEDPQAAHAAIEGILAAHVSTSERLEHRDQYIDTLSPYLSAAHSVLDVGAGVMPLLLPFQQFPGLTRYFAVDKDEEAMRAVNAYARWAGLEQLEACRWSISEGWEPLSHKFGTAEFDLGLMMKVVPVVARIESESRDVLAETPAARLIVSGSAHALAKRQRISQREELTIRSFCKTFDLKVLNRHETEDEVFLVIER